MADLVDRTPPQSIEAERAVLGSILLDPNCIIEVKAILKPEYFYRSAHMILSEKLYEMDDNKIPIDLVSVNEFLKDNKCLDEIGGNYYLTELISCIPSTANIEHHCQIILEKYNLRKQIVGIHEAGQMIFDGHTSCDVAEKLGTIAIQSYADKSIIKLSDGLHEVSNYIDERKANPGISGIKSGIHYIDEITTGFQTGLVIIAARPSMGKSAFLRKVALEAGGDNKTVAYFSLEDPRKMVILGMLSTVAKINGQNIRLGLIIDNDLVKIQQAQNKLSNDYNIFIDERGGVNTSYIKSKAMRIKQKYGLDVIIIDHLHKMTGEGDSRNYQLEGITNRLQDYAKELDCPVIIGCQIRRLGNDIKPRPPRLDDLRDSGAIEQNADVVIGIHRPEYYNRDDIENKGIAELHILKQRSGPTGIIKCTFLKEYASFENMTNQMI